MFWLLAIIVGGLLVLGLGLGLYSGLRTLLGFRLGHAKLECMHCGRETEAGRPQCQHCGGNL